MQWSHNGNFMLTGARNGVVKYWARLNAVSAFDLQCVFGGGICMYVWEGRPLQAGRTNHPTNRRTTPSPTRPSPQTPL